MNIFLVSDIFGRTPALEIIGETLDQSMGSLQIIDPYTGVNHGFETETSAYAYFTSHIGLEKYQSILTDHIEASGPDTVLIGFSVGASAIWGMSNQPRFAHITKAICFYSSQIRNKTGIQPRFEVELIFARKEPHFDVDELMHRLKDKPQVICEKSDGMHGFMNPLSDGYDPGCYLHYMNRLNAALKEFNHKKSNSV